MSRAWSSLVTVFALAFCLAPHARATVLFEGTDSGLSAAASFTISGAAGSRQLTILLTNTDTASGDGAPTASNQVLTGLFFNLGTAAFTPGSATLKGADGNITDEIDGTNQGISSYDSPVALDGANFGIVPTGLVEYRSNAGPNNDPVVAGIVRFVLNIPDGLEGDISSGDGSGSGGRVPEPATLSLLGIALAGASCRLRWRRAGTLRRAG